MPGKDTGSSAVVGAFSGKVFSFYVRWHATLPLEFVGIRNFGGVVYLPLASEMIMGPWQPSIGSELFTLTGTSGAVGPVL